MDSLNYVEPLITDTFPLHVGKLGFPLFFFFFCIKAVRMVKRNHVSFPIYISTLESLLY